MASALAWSVIALGVTSAYRGAPPLSRNNFRKSVALFSMPTSLSATWIGDMPVGASVGLGDPVTTSTSSAGIRTAPRPGIRYSQSGAAWSRAMGFAQSGRRCQSSTTRPFDERTFSNRANPAMSMNIEVSSRNSASDMNGLGRSSSSRSGWFSTSLRWLPPSSR